jgi:hypothetical protein
MAVDIVAQRRYVTPYRNFSADVGGAAQVTEPEIYRSPLPAPATGPPPVVAALRHAAADPDRPAVVDGATGQRLSRAELAERSAAMAAGLAGRGVGRGDLVAVALPNLGVWPVVAMGVWRAGAAVVPVSTRWTAEETARVLALVRPRMAIASEASLPPLRGALEAAGSDAEVVVHGEAEGVTPLQRLLAAGAGDRFAEPRLAPGDLAVVPFSSGTGGLAKGVRLTHGNLAASSAQVATSLGYGAGSVALSAVPFFHVMGLGLSLCVPLSLGARIVTSRSPTRAGSWRRSPSTGSPTRPSPFPCSPSSPTTHGPSAWTPPAWSCSPPPARTCPPRWSCAPASGCAAWRGRATG